MSKQKVEKKINQTLLRGGGSAGIAMGIRYRIRRDGKFFLIESLKYPVFTEGDSIEEAVANFKEAFLLFAEDEDMQAKYPELKRF